MRINRKLKFALRFAVVFTFGVVCSLQAGSSIENSGQWKDKGLVTSQERKLHPTFGVMSVSWERSSV